MVLSVERARTIVYGDRRKATGPVHYLRIDQVSVDHLSGFSHIQCALVDKGTGDLQSPLYGESAGSSVVFVRFVSSDGACPVVGLLALPNIFIANQKWSADAPIVESDTPFESLTTQRKPLACAHFTGEQLPSRARPQVFPSVSSVPPPLLLRSLLSAPGPLPDVPQLCVLAVRVWGPVVDAASTVAPPVAVRVTVATESGKKVESALRPAISSKSVSELRLQSVIRTTHDSALFGQPFLVEVPLEIAKRVSLRFRIDGVSSPTEERVATLPLFPDGKTLVEDGESTVKLALPSGATAATRAAAASPELRVHTHSLSTRVSSVPAVMSVLEWEQQQQQRHVQQQLSGDVGGGVVASGTTAAGGGGGGGEVAVVLSTLEVACYATVTEVAQCAVALVDAVCRMLCFVSQQQQSLSPEHLRIGRLALSFLSSIADASAAMPRVLNQFINTQLSVGGFWRLLLQACTGVVRDSATQADSRAVLRVLPLALNLAVAGRAFEMARDGVLLDATDGDSGLAGELQALLQSVADLLRLASPVAVAAQGLALKHCPAILVEARSALGSLASSQAAVDILRVANGEAAATAPTASGTPRLPAAAVAATATPNRAIALRAVELARAMLVDVVWLRNSESRALLLPIVVHTFERAAALSGADRSLVAAAAADIVAAGEKLGTELVSSLVPLLPCILPAAAANDAAARATLISLCLAAGPEPCLQGLGSHQLELFAGALCAIAGEMHVVHVHDIVLAASDLIERLLHGIAKRAAAAASGTGSVSSPSAASASATNSIPVSSSTSPAAAALDSDAGGGVWEQFAHAAVAVALQHAFPADKRLAAVALAASHTLTASTNAITSSAVSPSSHQSGPSAGSGARKHGVIASAGLSPRIAAAAAMKIISRLSPTLNSTTSPSTGGGEGDTGSPSAAEGESGGSDSAQTKTEDGDRAVAECAFRALLLRAAAAGATEAMVAASRCVESLDNDTVGAVTTFLRAMPQPDAPALRQFVARIIDGCQMFRDARLAIAENTSNADERAEALFRLYTTRVHLHSTGVFQEAVRLAEMQKLCNHSAEAAFMLQTAAASVDWCHKSKESMMVEAAALYASAKVTLRSTALFRQLQQHAEQEGRFAAAADFAGRCAAVLQDAHATRQAAAPVFYYCVSFASPPGSAPVSAPLTPTSPRSPTTPVVAASIAAVESETVDVAGGGVGGKESVVFFVYRTKERLDGFVQSLRELYSNADVVSATDFDSAPAKDRMRIGVSNLKIAPDVASLSSDSATVAASTNETVAIELLSGVTPPIQRGINDEHGACEFAVVKPLRIRGEKPAEDELKEVSLSVSIFRTALPLPGPLRRQRVISTQTFALSPLDYAVATVLAKTRDVEAVVGMCRAGVAPLELLASLLNGTIAAAVSGGVSRLRAVFLPQAPALSAATASDSVGTGEVRLVKALREHVSVLGSALAVYAKQAGPDRREFIDGLQVLTVCQDCLQNFKQISVCE